MKETIQPGTVVQLVMEGFPGEREPANKFWKALHQKKFELFLDGWKKIDTSGIAQKARDKHYSVDIGWQLSKGYGVTLTAYCGCQTEIGLDGVEQRSRTERCGDEDCDGKPRDADIKHNEKLAIRSGQLFLVGRDIPSSLVGRGVRCRECGDELRFDRSIVKRENGETFVVSDLKCSHHGLIDTRRLTTRATVREFVEPENDKN